MPDWSYQPLLKPILFRLPPSAARAITLGATGALVRLPFGRQLVRFVGGMKPPAAVAKNVSACSLEFTSPVGLAAGFPLDQHSILSLMQFGFGYIELGAVGLHAAQDGSDILSFNPSDEAITYKAQSSLYTLPKVKELLGKFKAEDYVFAVRLLPELNIPEAISELKDRCKIFVIDLCQCADSHGVMAAEQILKSLPVIPPGSENLNLLLSLPADCRFSDEFFVQAESLGVRGFVIADYRQGQCGRALLNDGLFLAMRLRKLLPNSLLVGSAGLIEPEDALNYLEHCQLVQLHSGFVFSGPGLAKRINEVITYDTVGRGIEPAKLLWTGWGGLAALGVGLIICSTSSFAVGMSSIILPYDEEFMGITKATLNSCNTHILQFMSHDRVTYSGTGLSTGILYFSLALFGARRQDSWLYKSMIVSAGVGFCTFLLFLGYHYFDKLHALVCLLLAPPYIYALLKRPSFADSGNPNRKNSRAWKNALLGQLLFVLIGFGLILAGTTIGCVGISSVFVKEDLAFMQTTAEQIRAISEKLVPVIAHDRAGFGGGLAANGLLVLMVALYGFAPRSRLVWWTLLIAGLSGFVPVLAIHWMVGYTDWWHLAPVYLASIWFLCGLAFSRQFMFWDGEGT